MKTVILFAFTLLVLAQPAALRAEVLYSKDGRSVDAVVSEFDARTGEVLITNTEGQDFHLSVRDFSFGSQIDILTSEAAVESYPERELSFWLRMRFRFVALLVFLPVTFLGFAPLSALVSGTWNPLIVVKGFLLYFGVSVASAVLGDVLEGLFGNSVVGSLLLLIVGLGSIYATLYVLKYHHAMSSMWKALGFYIGLGFTTLLAFLFLGLLGWGAFEFAPEVVAGVAEWFATTQVYEPLGWRPE